MKRFCFFVLSVSVFLSSILANPAILPKVLHMTPVYSPTFLELVVDGMAMFMFAKVPDLLEVPSFGYPVYIAALYSSIVLAGPLSRYFFLTLTTLLWRFAMDMDAFNEQARASSIENLPKKEAPL